MAAKKLRDIAEARDRPKRKGSTLNAFSVENAKDIYNEFKALLMRNVTLDGADYQTSDFVLNELIDANIIGYDKVFKHFYRAHAEGTLNEYYNPTRVTFIMPERSYQRRLSYDANPGGAYIIQALPGGLSWYTLLMRRCQRIADADNAIYQNLNAVRTPFIAVAKNDEMRLSVLTAIDQRQSGEPVIVVSGDVGEALKGVQTYTDYLVDKLNEYKQSERAAALNAISIVTANTDKRERVQVGEINAKIGECEDYIYTFIDNVNDQFESYDIPYKLRLSASLQNYLDKIEQQSDEDSAEDIEV